MPSPLHSLSLITVLHESGDVVAECLSSAPADVEVIVVDNASRDDGVARARAARPDARIVESRRNLGFGGGCNLGWGATRRPVLAFVNPDVRLEAGTLGTLLARLDREPHSMVGPELHESDGTIRPCKRRLSPLREAIALLPMAERWLPARLGGRLPAGHPVYREGGAVTSLEGACFVIRRADLERIGGFDEDLFLYNEEDDLAMRLALLGGRCIYEPRARAVHIGGTSTAKTSGFATRHRYRSRVIFLRKRDGAARGRLAALMLATASTLSLVVSLFETAVGRDTTTPPRFWLAVLRGVLDGARARARHPADA